ncbi:hypothetical protein HBB16_13650 [Pseudonocardia sp. MCCB 268]|nr:hypothetical protein [Pseudonocardia cytotoxica]
MHTAETEVAALDIPILFVVGEQDAIFFAATRSRRSYRIGTRCAVIPGTGHSRTSRHRHVRQEVSRFLADLRSPT